MKRLLSGNEAVARGAWEGGVVLAAGYPGTPSTEILEEFARFPGVYAEWSPNEKVALDVAIGAAYAGRRALASMKHVGLNVAADSLFYAAMTGMEAGLVIISADGPARLCTARRMSRITAPLGESSPVRSTIRTCKSACEADS